ncbi:MAG: hypothetical protein ACUVS2_11720 [Candidatus Flexifilum sp.]
MPYRESDLRFNRAGELSPDQRDRLLRQWRQIRLIGLLFGAIVFGVGLILLLAGEQGSAICAGVFFIAVSAGLLYLNRLIGLVQRKGAVAVISGRVQREQEEDEGTTIFTLVVDGIRLRLNDRTEYDQFEDGGRYRVYYLPRTRYVVSAEPAID